MVRFTSRGMFMSNERVPAMTCATFSPRFLATMAQLMVAVMSSTTSTVSAGCASSSRSKASMMSAVILEGQHDIGGDLRVVVPRDAKASVRVRHVQVGKE